MNIRAVKLTLFVGIMLAFCSCENSLNEIQKISSKEEDKPISRSTGVDLIYSDSAKVKAHVTAPLEINFSDNTPKPYREYPKGIKIVFYDDKLKESGSVVSDYAIQRDKENLIEFKRHVVATSAHGDVFKSDELIYDVTAKTFKSTKPVEITSPNGDVMEGVGADSNESLYPWHVLQTTGIFHVDEKAAQ